MTFAVERSLLMMGPNDVQDLCTYRCEVQDRARNRNLMCGHMMRKKLVRLIERWWHVQVMVYDAIMHENKALQEYTNEEVETDPLVFLNCGHVYPMSTLDGLLQLDSSYIRADSPDAPGGAWSAPRQLEVSHGF
jgi:hypothetical protein